jgi:hypothetical protein
MTLGSLGLVLVFGVIIRRQPALFTATMGAGALAWLVGNGLWLGGRPVYQVVLWWAGFLILTIVGERLELSRLLRLSARGYLGFLLALALFVGGIAWTGPDLDSGTRVAGAGMLGLALWLLQHDIARRTLRQRGPFGSAQGGLPRYIGACMLSGYVWLAIGGLLAMRFGATVAGPRYDATLHALFVGFVFSMIFGHAPIIFPVVLGREIVFRAAFYGPLALLHLSLALRIAGDLLDWLAGRRWGGLLNGLVVLWFVANIVYSLRRREGKRMAVS